jgi:crotonobetainyl-CoA:carnitine CoA-transferase CaiB-like acyl-CoA transferase
MSASSYKGPLEGIVVLDLTRVLAGPYCTAHLADLGATVIKIEDPDRGDSIRYTRPLVDGVSNHFLSLNKGKKSACIDLRAAEGRAVFLRLVRSADVVVENFRPGVLARLGLDHEVLTRENPGVILCSISGFGQAGAYSDRPSFDVITQALSGAMSVTGEPGRPPVRLGIPLGDLGGGLFGTISVLAALQERTRTGRGQAIDISLLDSLFHLMLYYPLDVVNAGVVAGPVGGRHEHLAPYGLVRAKDGYLVLAIFQGKFWRLFCDAIESPDLAGDPRFATVASRYEHQDQLYELIERVLATRQRAEWEEVFTRYGIPHAPVLTLEEVVNFGPILERQMLVPHHHPRAGDVKVAGTPFKLSGDLDPVGASAAPELGEHTVGVLRDLANLADDEIAALLTSGVVADPSRPPAERPGG